MRLKTHGSNQLEIIFDYGFPKTRKRIQYDAEVQIQFPPRIGIHEGNYSHDKFYQDIKSYLRLQEPKLKIAHFKAILEGANAELDSLEKKILLEKNSENKNQFLPFENTTETKIFACAFIVRYLKRMEKIKRRLNKVAEKIKSSPSLDRSDLHNVTQQTLDSLTHLLELFYKFRGFSSKVVQIENLNFDMTWHEMKLIDEYCSYRLRDGLLFIQQTVDELLLLTTSEELNHLKKLILDSLIAERQYSKSMNYFWLDENSSERYLEDYVKRRGKLKRRIWSVLFLESHKNRFFHLQKNFGPMVAAGLAALWAFVAQVAVFQALGRGIENPAFRLLSVGSVTIGVLAVVAYIIKDRIKEIGRTQFHRGLTGKLPDHAYQISYRNSQNKLVIVGSMQEAFDFAYLPDLKISEHEKLAKDENGKDKVAKSNSKNVNESISQTLIYKKVFRIFPARIRKTMTRDTRGVHDVIRFNTTHIRKFMSDPQENILLLGSNDMLQKRPLPKTYDLYVNLHLQQKTGFLQKKTSSNVKYLVTCSKDEIVRIEKIKKPNVANTESTEIVSHEIVK